MKITPEQLIKLVEDKLGTTITDKDGYKHDVVNSYKLAKFLVEEGIIKSE